MNTLEAYAEMRAGGRVRLPHWPEGQYLKIREFRSQPGERDVAVYRDIALSALSHNPSGAERASVEWESYTLPPGVTEVDTLT